MRRNQAFAFRELYATPDAAERARDERAFELQRRRFQIEKLGRFGLRWVEPEPVRKRRKMNPAPQTLAELLKSRRAKTYYDDGEGRVGIRSKGHVVWFRWDGGRGGYVMIGTTRSPRGARRQNPQRRVIPNPKGGALRWTRTSTGWAAPFEGGLFVIRRHESGGWNVTHRSGSAQPEQFVGIGQTVSHAKMLAQVAKPNPPNPRKWAVVPSAFKDWKEYWAEVPAGRTVGIWSSRSKAQHAAKGLRDHHVVLVKGKGNPASSLRAQFRHQRLQDPATFDRRSFRAVVQDGHRLIVGCPKGQFKGGRCRVGTEAQALLHPQGERNPCPNPPAWGVRWKTPIMPASAFTYYARKADADHHAAALRAQEPSVRVEVRKVSIPKRYARAIQQNPNGKAQTQVAFTTTKQGQLRAWRWSIAAGGRWFPISVKEARHRVAMGQAIEVTRRQAPGGNPQESFDPLEYGGSATEAKKARDARYRDLKQGGAKVKRFVLKGQLRKYSGLGQPSGEVRDVYYVQHNPPRNGNPAEPLPYYVRIGRKTIAGPFATATQAKDAAVAADPTHEKLIVRRIGKNLYGDPVPRDQLVATVKARGANPTRGMNPAHVLSVAHCPTGHYWAEYDDGTWRRIPSAQGTRLSRIFGRASEACPAHAGAMAGVENPKRRHRKSFSGEEPFTREMAIRMSPKEVAGFWHRRQKARRAKGLPFFTRRGNPNGSRPVLLYRRVRDIEADGYAHPRTKDEAAAVFHHKFTLGRQDPKRAHKVYGLPGGTIQTRAGDVLITSRKM